MVRSLPQADPIAGIRLPNRASPLGKHRHSGDSKSARLVPWILAAGITHAREISRKANRRRAARPRAESRRAPGFAETRNQYWPAWANIARVSASVNVRMRRAIIVNPQQFIGCHRPQKRCGTFLRSRHNTSSHDIYHDASAKGGKKITSQGLERGYKTPKGPHPRAGKSRSHTRIELCAGPAALLIFLAGAAGAWIIAADFG